MNDPCRHHERDITRWLDDELPAKAAKELEAHLKTCPACQALIAQQRQLRDQCRLPAPLISNAADRDAILRAAARQATRHRQSAPESTLDRFRQLLRQPLFVNTAAVCGIMAVVLLGLDLRRQIVSADPQRHWDHSVPVYSLIEYQSVITGTELAIQSDAQLPATR